MNLCCACCVQQDRASAPLLQDRPSSLQERRESSRMAAATSFKNPKSLGQLVEGSTAFALDLYKEVSARAGSRPWSSSTGSRVGMRGTTSRWASQGSWGGAGGRAWIGSCTSGRALIWARADPPGGGGCQVPMIRPWASQQAARKGSGVQGLVAASTEPWTRA